MIPTFTICKDGAFRINGFTKLESLKQRGSMDAIPTPPNKFYNKTTRIDDTSEDVPIDMSNVQCYICEDFGCLNFIVLLDKGDINDQR